MSSFGEFEFWFAGVKVATIVGFLVLGTRCLRLLPGHGMDLKNPSAHGASFPTVGAASLPSYRDLP